MDRTRTAPQRKAEGAHYTPPALADFVANHIVQAFGHDLRSGVTILDPACGDGSLLIALIRALEARRASGARIEVEGFDTSIEAVAKTRTAVQQLEVNSSVHLRVGDFLGAVVPALTVQGSLFPQESKAIGPFDMVIANPPYVRTQVMGADKAQKLAETFALAGRVDLYFAFLRGMGRVLKPSGIAGIIVSNRFMTTQAGATLRESIKNDFDILRVYDFGDTRLFEAAVLPAVLILRKRSSGESRQVADYVSIYTVRNGDDANEAPNVFDAIRTAGRHRLPNGEVFEVKHGRLDTGGHDGAVWRLATDAADEWLATVRTRTAMTFGDVGPIRVGVKTTADQVFVRSDWNELPEGEQPESDVLRPIITHHTAQRFRSALGDKRVLYTHTSRDGKRVAIDLEAFPRAARYLERHRERLTARTFVIEAGRSWFEIWVPQDPDTWRLPKLVFRDISVEPMFWIDRSGAVVNGDCYWLAVERSREDLLYLAAAVGNSTFIEAFYDHRFNNKLYSGRRRFITQYVREFPLPNPSSPEARQMIDLARRLAEGVSPQTAGRTAEEIDALVWKAFGLRREEVAR